MSQHIEQFERDCRSAGINPVAVLKAAGLNSSTWFRWKSGRVSPTLRSFEAAQEALSLLRDGVAPEEPSAANDDEDPEVRQRAA